MDEVDTPGAGPSTYEDEDRERFLKRRQEYQELEQSVESSTELLSSLASYLSTFQNDLSEVSGQISELQQKSAEIESKLKGRRTVIPSLNALLSDITLPPSLVLAIRDTQPAQSPDLWLTAIQQLEDKIHAIKSRGKVRASSDLEDVLEGLKTKALNQIPPFLLSLIRPLKSASKGLSTNLPVLQTSVLLKYQPFYTFLVRQNERLAKHVERGYVNAARGYYETGMRRYTRALGVVKSRTIERSELIGVVSSEAALDAMDKMAPGIQQAYERLKYADLDVEGEGAVLGYMADDKDYRTPIEALFKSLGLVLIDNGSAEFTFLVRFFSQPLRNRETPLESPSPSTDAMSEAGRRSRPEPQAQHNLKDAERLFHEIFDPALESATMFFNSIITSPPPSVPLLTIIRLNDHLISTCELRGTIPLVNYLTGWKLALWPLYRKEMDNHVNSMKKLADEAGAKGLAGMMAKGVKDGVVRQVAIRYAALFSCVTALSEEAEEAMIFSSMTRMRNELVRLATTQSEKIKALPERYSFLSSIYEVIMRELVSGPGATTHPKMQSELSFFRTREEEARRRISV